MTRIPGTCGAPDLFELLDNAPPALLCEVVAESLQLCVRGVPGGPYAAHDRRCLDEYEALTVRCSP